MKLLWWFQIPHMWCRRNCFEYVYLQDLLGSYRHLCTCMESTVRHTFRIVFARRKSFVFNVQIITITATHVKWKSQMQRWKLKMVESSIVTISLSWNDARKFHLEKEMEKCLTCKKKETKTKAKRELEENVWQMERCIRCSPGFSSQLMAPININRRL